jgi:hypothetical protein
MCGVVPTREQAVEIARRVMFSIMWTCTKRLEAFVDSLVVLGLFKGLAPLFAVSGCPFCEPRDQGLC